MHAGMRISQAFSKCQAVRFPTAAKSKSGLVKSGVCYTQMKTYATRGTATVWRSAGQEFKDTAINRRLLMVSAGAVVGIGALAAYGIATSGPLTAEAGLSTMQRSLAWPDYVAHRVHSTYAHVAGSVAIAGASAVSLARSPAFLRLASRSRWLLPIGTLVTSIGAMLVTRAMPYPADGSLSAKHFVWMFHSASLGAMVAPLLILVGQPAVVVHAAAYTGAIVAALSTAAATAPSERFLYMSGPLSIGLGVVATAGLCSAFMPMGRMQMGLTAVWLYGGLALFSGLMLYNTQVMIRRAEQHPAPGYGPPYDPINGSISLTLDIMNIFIRVLMLTGGGNNKK